MSRELDPDEVDLTEVDLTESRDMATAMSAAVERLRELAAAAFNAGGQRRPDDRD